MHEIEFKEVQFVGHAISTAPALVSGARLCWRGHDSDYEDAAARIAWTRRILDEARRRCASDPHTLKLLMLPDLYFGGRRGGYDPGLIAWLVRALQDLVQSAEWAAWLFVFGSVSDAHSSSGEAGDAGLCLVQLGGWNPDKDELEDEERAAALAQRCRMIRCEGDRVEFAVIKWPRAGLRVERIVAPRDRADGLGDGGARCFTLAGVRFGLEGTLDHLDRRLKNSPRTGGPDVQIQLIPSCGIDIIPEAVIAGTGGYVFNVDGAYDLAARGGGCHSQLKRIERGFASLEHPAAILSDDIAPREELSLSALAGCERLFARGPGVLSIYRPLALTRS